MTTAPLSPQEIVAFLRDPKIIDAPSAVLLEQRIKAYTEHCVARAREQGKLEAIIEAVKKAETTANYIRGERQQAGACKVVWAVKGLLPDEAAKRRELAAAHNAGYNLGRRERISRTRNPRGQR